MPESHDVAPVVGDALFHAVCASTAPVNVPLVLARHVAGVPADQGPSLTASGHLREVVEELGKRGKAAVVWDPSARGRRNGAGTVEYFFREEEIQVHTRASLDTGRATRRFLLDTNGAVLFQGTVNAFLHYLNPLMIEHVEQAPYLDPGTRPAIINRPVAALTRWARAQMEGGSRQIRLFAASCRDRYGQPGILEALWHVNPAYISWGWRSDERAVRGYLSVQEATWVSGLMTLVRLTYPDEWTWQPDSRRGT